MDDSDKTALQCKVLAFYERGEFSSSKKLLLEMNKDIGFKSREVSVLRILKSVVQDMVTQSC
jgi:hypothetical protein